MEKDSNEKQTDTVNEITNNNDTNDIIFDDESFIDDILNDSDLIGASFLPTQACKIQLN